MKELSACSFLFSFSFLVKERPTLLPSGIARLDIQRAHKNPVKHAVLAQLDCLGCAQLTTYSGFWWSSFDSCRIWTKFDGKVYRVQSSVFCWI